MERYADMGQVLNGSWTEDRFVHFCIGDGCPCGGEPHKRVVEVLMKTVLVARPMVPQLSRWSKGVGSLDFWLLGLGCHGFSCICYTRLF